MVTCAKDIMTTELVLGHPKMTLEEAIKTLVNNRITGMPVVDEEKRVIGVISEYDIIRAVERHGKNPPLNLGQPIEYNHSVESVKEDTRLPEILKKFVEFKVRRLPVVNSENRLVGIVTRRDIMRVLFYRSKNL